MPRKKKVGVGEGVPENKSVDGTPNGGVDPSEIANSSTVKELGNEPPFQVDDVNRALLHALTVAYNVDTELLTDLAVHVVITLQVIQKQSANVSLVEPRLGGFDVEHVQDLERRVRAAGLI